MGIIHSHVFSETCTFVIQGPIRKEAITAIGFYRKYTNNIILSTWKPTTGIEADLLEECKELLPEHRIFINHLPDTTNISNQQNLYYQIQSTLNGLVNCQTQYVIKVRTDEYYEKWDYFLNMMFSSPNKLTTGNTFFRPVVAAYYHPSDHIMSGTLYNLLMLFNSAKLRAERNDRVMGVEHFLTTSYLIAKNVEIVNDYAYCRRIMKEHFNVVPVDKFKHYNIKNNDHNVHATEETIESSILDKFKPSIVSLDEL